MIEDRWMVGMMRKERGDEERREGVMRGRREGDRDETLSPAERSDDMTFEADDRTRMRRWAFLALRWSP